MEHADALQSAITTVMGGPRATTKSDMLDFVMDNFSLIVAETAKFEDFYVSDDEEVKGIGTEGCQTVKKYEAIQNMYAATAEALVFCNGELYNKCREVCKIAEKEILAFQTLKSRTSPSKSR